MLYEKQANLSLMAMVGYFEVLPLIILLPTSYILLLTSYFLLPTSYFLLPTSYFLHLKTTFDTYVFV
ncbi:MAG: hypothetical protein R3E32_17030 [Chitinophagales bacterium]